MSIPKINSYEIKISKTEEKIPVVNGVHLHSIYNPIKEALSLANKNEDTLRSKNEVLILGLGFGYHIEEIARCLKEFHGNNFKIVVIEPNQQVVSDYRETIQSNTPNIKIYSAKEISELYARPDLVTFLIKKPGVIAHPASFNLYSTYFKSFLTYQAPADTMNICQHIQSPEMKEFISGFEVAESLDQLVDKQILEKGEIDDERGFILGAFRALTIEKTTPECAGEQ